MPWCPKCKNEYKEGVTICNDCGQALLLEEEGENKALTFGSKEEMEELAGFLEYSKIEGTKISYDEIEEVYEIFVPKKESAQASKLLFVYMQQKHNEITEEIEEEKSKSEKNIALYENSAIKAEDNKSSAYTLLIVGIAGMIVIALGLAGVLPIHLSGTSKYMTYGIMSALFILFIVMGMISMKSYQIFAKKAESEYTLKGSIEKWCLETLKQEQLDTEVFSDEEMVSDEVKYFKRTTLLKEKIEKQFLNLDEAFLDNFVDEIYGDIFEEE